jgi:hypothetical protein
MFSKCLYYYFKKWTLILKHNLKREREPQKSFLLSLVYVYEFSFLFCSKNSLKFPRNFTLNFLLCVRKLTEVNRRSVI